MSGALRTRARKGRRRPRNTRGRGHAALPRLPPRPLWMKILGVDGHDLISQALYGVLYELRHEEARGSCSRGFELPQAMQLTRMYGPAVRSKKLSTSYGLDVTTSNASVPRTSGLPSRRPKVAPTLFTSSATRSSWPVAFASTRLRSAHACRRCTAIEGASKAAT